MVSFHSVELRSRVLYICFSLVWSFWLIWDCCECLLFNLCSINLVFTSLYEGFVCFVWLTCMLGVICNIPLIMYHGVCFLSCGLYEVEFRKCVKTVCTVVCVFTCSLLFCVWLVLPSLVSFFLDFESEFLVATIKIVDFVLVLGGLCQFCVLCCVVPFIPRVSRKLLYFGVLLVCALLTPPDVVSLLLVSVPLIGVLEVSFLCRKF